MTHPYMQYILHPPYSKTNRLNSNPKSYIGLNKHYMGHIGPYASNVCSSEDSFFIWFKRTLHPLMKYDQGKISEMRHI